MTTAIHHPTPEAETIILTRLTGEPVPATEGPGARPRSGTPVLRTTPGRHAAPSRYPEWARRWATRAAVFLPPTLLALVLGLTGLGRRRMWGDEYATWYAVTLPWRGLFQLLDHVDRVLSEYYVLMHVWVRLAGDSPAALRLPSAVAMACAAGFTALLGRRLAGPAVGLLAGTIFAVLPMVTRYAQEARPYGFVVAGGVLTTLLLLRALDRPVWARWAPYAIGMVLLAWLHLVAVLVLAAHLVLVWRAYRAADRDVRLWKFVGALAIVFAGVAPLALSAHRQAAAISWIHADLHTVRQTPERVFGTTTLAAAIILLALLAPLIAAKPARRAALPLALWAVLPPLLTYATFPLLHLFLYRYLLFTLPAWALLVALAVAAAARLAPRAWAPAALATAAVVGLSMVVYLAVPGQESVRKPVSSYEPDFHTAAAVIRAAQHPGDGIAYAGQFRHPRNPMRYEMRGGLAPDDVFLAPTAPVVAGYRLGECHDSLACLGKHSRLWLVTTTYSRDPFMDMPKERAVLLRQDFLVVADHKLNKLRVLLLVHRP